MWEEERGRGGGARFDRGWFCVSLIDLVGDRV